MNEVQVETGETSVLDVTYISQGELIAKCLTL